MNSFSRPLSQVAVEVLARHRVEQQGEFWVIAMPLVSHESMLAVELVPGKTDAGRGHRVVNHPPSFGGNVWVLPAPNHQHLGLNFRDAIETVVVHPFAETSFVNVGGIEANSGIDFLIHRRSKCQVPAQADADRADFSGAAFVTDEEVDDGSSVGIVGGNFLFDLQAVAAVGALFVVGERLAQFGELVIDIRNGDQQTVSRQHGCGAGDRSRHLVDLAVENHTGIAAGAVRTKQMRPHRTGGRFEIDEGGSLDSHAESGRCQISEWHSEEFAENQDCDTFYQLDEDEGNRLLCPIGIERCP